MRHPQDSYLDKKFNLNQIFKRALLKTWVKNATVSSLGWHYSRRVSRQARPLPRLLLGRAGTRQEHGARREYGVGGWG